MSKKIEWINPYIFKTDNEHFYSDYGVDMCDSSGYLPLKDQLNIITNNSELNYQFRLGQVDSYNAMKEVMNNSEFSDIKSFMAEFETDDYNNEQLLKYRNGDLIDKQTLLQQAYNSGYSVGFFPTGRSEANEPDIQTSGVQQENNQTGSTNNEAE